MNKNYICAMCGNVVNEDNIEVLLVGAGQLIICKNCYNDYDDETPIECNFQECTNCGEFVLFFDNECNYCGWKYKKNQNLSTKKYNINTFYFLYSKSKIYLTKYFGGVKHGKIFKYGQS